MVIVESVRGCMMRLNSRCLILLDIGIEGTKIFFFARRRQVFRVDDVIMTSYGSFFISGKISLFCSIYLAILINGKKHCVGTKKYEFSKFLFLCLFYYDVIMN